MNNHLITHIICLLGVAIFLWLELPLPWLFGPLFSCLLAALIGINLYSIKILSDAMRTILGVAVGATVTLSFLLALPGFWNTLIFIPITVILSGIIGVWYFQKLCGYDFPTAYYSSMPGGLQDMLVFGEEAGGNVRAMSLIHATRVLVIIIALPILLTFIWGISLDKPPGDPIKNIEIEQLIILGICGIAGWKIASFWGMFGASILGPLILTAIASITGILHTRPPVEAIWAAQYFIALGIGEKYVGVTAQEIRKDILAGLGFCIFLLVITLSIVSLVINYNLAPAVDAILSMAPGGQAELVVITLIVGADLGFVVAHHLFRIFIVILGAPIMERFMKSKYPH
ncbi:MAG: AbrB family transcriptional regulator [Rhodobacteraceae bacterium]|nr:AbrB family transcriptional regulator [Paracoccaceae bacterium]